MEPHSDVKALNTQGRKLQLNIIGNGVTLKVAEQKADTIGSTLEKASFNTSEYNQQESEIIQEVIYVTTYKILHDFEDALSTG